MRIVQVEVVLLVPSIVPIVLIMVIQVFEEMLYVMWVVIILGLHQYTQEIQYHIIVFQLVGILVKNILEFIYIIIPSIPTTT